MDKKGASAKIIVGFVVIVLAIAAGYFGLIKKSAVPKKLPLVQSSLSAFETIGYWYDSTSGEDWDTLRRITVDIDGSTYDDVCFEEFKKSVGWHKDNTINVEYESTENSCVILENSISNPRCRMISYNINETDAEGKFVHGGDGLAQLIFLDGEWKKQIGCAKTADEIKTRGLNLVRVESIN